MHTAERAASVGRAGLPPGPDLPPARQSARWIARPLSFLRESRERYGDVFTLRVLHQDPWVIVGDPELVKHVFTAPADILHAGESNRHVAPIVGPGSMLIMDEGRHMRQRKPLLPPFHGDRIARFGELMRAVVDEEIDRWPVGVPEPAAPHMQALTLEVILRAVFGVTERRDLDSLRAVLGELVGAVAGGARIPLLGRPERLRESRFEDFRLLLDDAREQVRLAVARHRRHGDLDRREDVLSMLLEARFEDGSQMSDAELRDELMTLLLAGHETTAATLAWALERLVRHPEALARTVAEADAGGGPYTDAVIKETLRSRPAFAVVSRLVKQPFQLAGYTIPPGVTIMPSIALVHHRPDVYPDPDAFRPERFLDRTPGTYTWIPFGGGVRRCVGAAFSLFEMRVVLSTLLTRMSVRAGDPDPELPKRRLITFAPSRGASVILEPR